MRTCMHGEQTVIIFGLPCWFSSSQLSRLSPCVMQKWSTGRVHAWHNHCLFCAPVSVIREWASSGVISSLIVTFVCRPLVLTCCFYRTKPNYEIVADCKMHLSGVFPQCRTLLSRSEPGEQRWGSCQPDSSSVLSSHVPPTWLNMTNSPSQNKPRGVSCATTDPLHAQAPLCPCTNGAQHPSCPAAPIPLQKQTNHGLLYRVDVLVHWKSSVFNWYQDRDSREGTWANERNGTHLLSPCLLSRPSWETGYTVFCQQAVSGNYGLHCRLRAPSLWHCAPQCDTKHGRLTWASSKVQCYATGSNTITGWTYEHTNTWKGQVKYAKCWMAHLLLCIRSSCWDTVISHVVGVCCCKALGPASEALQLHHNSPSNRVWHHHGRPLRIDCVQIIIKYMKTTREKERVYVRSGVLRSLQ